MNSARTLGARNILMGLMKGNRAQHPIDFNIYSRALQYAACVFYLSQLNTNTYCIASCLLIIDSDLRLRSKCSHVSQNKKQ